MMPYQPKILNHEHRAAGAPAQASIGYNLPARLKSAFVTSELTA
jgi:hypothetical protein